MAEVKAALFFRSNRVYKISSIELDLILSESHNFSNTVTQLNVEDGSIISDHIQNNLENGSLTGLVSNFSLKRAGSITSNRAQEVFDELRDLWKKRSLIQVVTIYRVYNNVAITNINPVRDDTTGEAISFELSFQEVNIVKLQEVVIEAKISLANMDNEINQQASPNLDLGRLSATPVGL